jgi:hypothetical protein
VVGCGRRVMKHCKREGSGKEGLVGKGLGSVVGQIDLLHGNFQRNYLSKQMRPVPTALLLCLDWRFYDLRPRVHTSPGAIMKPPSVPNGSREAN